MIKIPPFASKATQPDKRIEKLMSEEAIVLKVFNDEIDARMAQELLQEAGVQAFVFKDDGGGMEPHLQRTIGVRLIVDRAYAERAEKILGS